MESKRIKKKNQSQNLFFRWVANLFIWLSRITGRTYNEMNVVIYFGAIPFSWALMLDILLGWGYFSFGFICFTAGVLASVNDFSAFSDRIFNQSVQFLLLFNRFGSTYEKSSVFICVFLPLLIYALLIYFMCFALFFHD